MPPLPAPPESPFSESVAALAFSMADHKVLCAFRNRLRRKAIWAVVTPLHHELAEALEVYRPYEAPEKAEPTWTIWRSAAGVWVLDKECGPLGEPTTLTEAVEIVEGPEDGDAQRRSCNPQGMPTRTPAEVLQQYGWCLSLGCFQVYGRIATAMNTLHTPDDRIRRINAAVCSAADDLRTVAASRNEPGRLP
jgi:hypothetical protein